MTSREHKYTIEIFFDISTKSKNIYTGNVPYVGSTAFKDDFSISNDKIVIESFRSAVVKFESIFYNHYSSLYNQIIKSLIFYYATTKKFVPINSIKITRSKNGKKLERKIFKSSDFVQVLEPGFKLLYTIDHTRLQTIFDNSAKSQATLFAISYILKANTLSSESEKFEKLWKAFNRLFFLIGGDKKDFTCLRNLRQFIINNPGILVLSSPKVTNFDHEKLRNAIRWREMLLDNYSTEALTGSFRDFILRYNDKRIMEILLKTKYGYREEFLRRNGLFVQVDNHIQNSIAADTKDDSEIISLLTGKYMYFVRNKTFHGEKIDSTFRLLVNKEDKELKFLNSILEPYLIDLVNANNLY